MNVLVTAIGTLSATQIIRMLRAEKDIVIYGGDIYPVEYIVTSTEVDHFIQMPSVVEDKRYLEFLLQLCKEQQISYIFPVIDEEVELLANNKDRFLAIGTVPCVSDSESVNLCRDKYETFKFIESIAPELYVKTQVLDQIMGKIDYPAFIKPRKGRASIGCCRVDSDEDISYATKGEDHNDIIVQSLCKGDIVSVDMVRDPKQGVVQVVMREEVLRNKNGAATGVKIIEDTYLKDICIKIANSIGIKGICNVEVFIDRETNTYSLIEINPRFPAGTEFSCRAGVNLIKQHFEVIKDNTIEIVEPKVGNVYVRRYETYETKSI